MDNNWPAALGLIPSGLFVLSAGTGPSATAMLSSWVQQCSFEPPRIVAALKPDRVVAGLLVEGGAFVLNQLAAGQTQLLAHFGRGFDPGEPVFDGLEITPSADGVPIINAAVGHLECRVVGRVSGGDHDLILGEIHGGGIHSSERPYVHIRKTGLKY